MVDLPAFPVRFVSLSISTPLCQLYLFVPLAVSECTHFLKNINLRKVHLPYIHSALIINQGNIEEVSYVHEIVPVAIFC